MLLFSALKRSLLKRSFTTTVLPYEKVHVPVLLQEVLSGLSPREGGIYCDMTFGDGGYTKALLDSCNCKVVAIDQDPTAYTKALQLAEVEPYKHRLFPILGKFGTVNQEVQMKFPNWQIPCFDGMVMDIGVSSGQIQTPERGFSYKLDGPLDMRMSSRGKKSSDTANKADDSNNGTDIYEKENELLKKTITAYEIVNFFHQDHIADIIYQYGQDRLSRRIAAAIVEARQKAPIETTRQLASIINKACPQPGWLRGEDDVVRNSAARTFQAFRIFINNELDELKKGLSASEYLLKPGGRLAIVTFHSLEDSIAKGFFNHCSGKRDIATAGQNQFKLGRAAYKRYMKASKYDLDASPRQPEASKVNDTVPSFVICNKHVVRASDDEARRNVRSRSAKLRVVERTVGEPLNPFGMSH